MFFTKLFSELIKSRIHTKSMTEKIDIKTLVFLDIETTGLPKDENNTTKITELSMIAIQSSHLRLGVIPRVQNKLTLCFNPWKLISYESEKITDLSNQLLEEMSAFTGETVFTINGFLNQLPKPICLVAHNGNYFDYPILRRTVDKTNIPLLEVYCMDTLEMFREFQLESTTQELAKDETDLPCTSLPNTPQSATLYKVLNSLEIENMAQIQRRNETTPKKQMIRKNLISEFDETVPIKKFKKDRVRQRLNFQKGLKLVDLYKKFTNKDPVDAHRAEGDNNLLMTCVAFLGDTFIEWSNKNAKKFCDIPAMTPSKKIGT